MADDNAGVSIRRIGDLIRDVEDGALILQPPFQRRLVWTNVVKDNFLETVRFGLPFPEIFIATGEIDTKSMKRKNLLVDGQQRISTLREYIQGSSELVLKKVVPYSDLEIKEQEVFLNYRVAVRDLGSVTPDQIKDIFSRINSTDYSLKAIERLNALFSGAYKQFCDVLSRHRFFDQHNTFTMTDLRRMRDLDFCVILVTTLLSTYYNRDELNRQYLERFNDDFPKGPKLLKQIEEVFAFIEACKFDKKCRVWKKTDLLTILVELHAFSQRKELDAAKVGKILAYFYAAVDELYAMKGTDEELAAKEPHPNVSRYLKAATKATNDKYARADRAEVIATLLEATLDGKPSRAKEPAKKSKK